MKITRYPQSCFLIETQGHYILIDPGLLNFENEFLNEWKKADCILITHKHTDHCYPDAIKIICRNTKVKIYTNKEVANLFPELFRTIVKPGDKFQFEGITIEVTNAVHGYLPLLKGSNEINENVGYIIDDGVTRVYHTSDTICFKNDYQCDVLLSPISNHGLVMGSYETILFAKETGAKLIIPMHYDNPKYPVNQKEIKKEWLEQNINFKFLDCEENLDV